MAVERSLDLPVVLLAVVKAGHAFVPIDPVLPVERVRQMAAAAGVTAFVTSRTLMAAAETGLPVIDLSRDAARLAAASSARFPRSAAAGDPTAYVIFTSGTTGTPKGIEVGHTALANFLGSMADSPGFTANDCIVAVTTVSFDIAALELLLPLCCGGRTVIAGRDILAEPPQLARLIGSSGATVLQATPTLWRVLLEAGFQPGPRFKALCGGEPLPRDLAAQLIATGVELWNMYGPTETTIWSACGRVTDANGPIAIGSPIANTELHVLDDAEALTPIGVPGELYIGGRGLAKGYIGQPGLTQRSFPVTSLGGGAPRRFYRTGDIAVRTVGGGIQLLGRRDQQVKVRGFRIELEEIEAVLRSYPGVRDAAVAVERAGHSGRHADRGLRRRRRRRRYAASAARSLRRPAPGLHGAGEVCPSGRSAKNCERQARSEGPSRRHRRDRGTRPASRAGTGPCRGARGQGRQAGQDRRGDRGRPWPPGHPAGRPHFRTRRDQPARVPHGSALQRGRLRA